MAVPVTLFRQELERESFSDYLPYIAYENGVYLTQDSCLGIIFECTPLPVGGDDTYHLLRGLFEIEYPPYTTIQISLLALKNPNHILNRWLSARQKNTIYYKIAQERIKFLSQRPIYEDIGIALRDFTVLVSIKFPPGFTYLPSAGEESVKKVITMQKIVGRALKNIGLNPRPLEPQRLINIFYQVFNPGHSPDITLPYDENQEIRKQIIMNDTAINVKKDEIIIDNYHFLSATVKQHPPSFSLLSCNNLIGNPLETFKQTYSPFMLTLNVITLDQEKDKKTYEVKGAAISYQSLGPLARLVKRLKAKAEGFQTLFDELSKGYHLLKAYLHLVVWDEDRERTESSMIDFQSFWRTEGFVLSTDSYINLPLLRASLPLGLIASNDSNLLKKFHTMTSANAASLAPIQADWKGTESSTLLLISRKGQPAFIDLFDNYMGNYNSVIVAGSGSGKSFMANEIIISYLGTGGRVWVFDIGRSFYKLAQMLEGQFMVFGPDSDVCLNPFTLVTNLDEELEILKPLLCQMASPTGELDDLRKSIIEESIKLAFQRSGNKTTITDITSILLESEDPRAKDIAQMLTSYTKKGMYARFFEGDNNVNFYSNFIVLELEELAAKPELQSVVLMLLIYTIQKTMFFGDRNQKKVMIIDEAWDMLRGKGTAEFIEKGFRRFRKYGGSAICITQRVKDFRAAEAGMAAWDNADQRIFLRLEDLPDLKEVEGTKLDELSYRMIETLATVGGRFSECFVRVARIGAWVYRLIVDPFSYWLYTTNPSEYQKVDNYFKEALERGIPRVKALEEAIYRCIKEARR